MIFLIALAICVMFGLISGAVASSRGHGFMPFFFLGALISPLLAIILAFVITPPRQSTGRYRGRRLRRKKRPVYTRSQGAAADNRNPYKAPTATYGRYR